MAAQRKLWLYYFYDAVKVKGVSFPRGEKEDGRTNQTTTTTLTDALSFFTILSNEK